MTRLRRFENKIADGLERFPKLRAGVKKSYQCLNQARYVIGRSKLRLHPEVSMVTPDQWAGTSAATLDTFFGYFDISPFSLACDVAVFHETRPDDAVDIVAYDAKTHVRRTIATSTAWNLQQGSMLQWMPNQTSNKVIFNTVDKDQLVSKIVSLEDGSETMVPWPVQAVHPAGHEFLSINYRRLYRLRVEYGYRVSVINFSPEQPLDRDGIWRIDPISGKGDLIVSIAELVKHESREEFARAEHWVNHVIYAPEGERFLFMHRWKTEGRMRSRLYLTDMEGKKLKILLDDDFVSHYSWCDSHYVLVYARTKQDGNRYYLLDVRDGTISTVARDRLDCFGDGHPTYSPDRQWILTDTYPDRSRQQHLFLFHLPTERLIEVGRFFEPWKYNGPTRCDLHPRWSSDGTMISIDSTHTGHRKTYLLDVTKLVAR